MGLFIRNSAVNEKTKNKGKFCGQSLSYTFWWFTKLTFTTSETMCVYCFLTWYVQVPSWSCKRLKTYNLSKLGNITRVSKLHKMIA